MPVGILDIAVRIGLTLATSFLFAVVFVGYWRTRSLRMILISMGFGIFFVHALITIPELFSDAYHIAMSENVHLLIHLIGLIFIMAGVLKD